MMTMMSSNTYHTSNITRKDIGKRCYTCVLSSNSSSSILLAGLTDDIPSVAIRQIETASVVTPLNRNRNNSRTQSSNTRSMLGITAVLVIVLSFSTTVVLITDAFTTQQNVHSNNGKTSMTETRMKIQQHQPRRQRRRRTTASQFMELVVVSSSPSDDDEGENNNGKSKNIMDDEERDTNANAAEAEEAVVSYSFRQSVKKLAKRIVSTKRRVLPDPAAIGAVIKDASFAAVEEVEKEASSYLLQQQQNRRMSSSSNNIKGGDSENTSMMLQSMVEEAFRPMDESLQDMEDALMKAKTSCRKAKLQSYQAMEEVLQLAAASVAAIEQEQEQQQQRKDDKEEEQSLASDDTIEVINYQDLDDLTYEDIDYESSEMVPPYIDSNSCLMPDAEPVVRVEKAPDNSRRIFAGIDISASADDVWNVLTKYDELQNVIPNLVVNDVLELYDAIGEESNNEKAEETEKQDDSGGNITDEAKCENISKTMKGSLLRQTGGAKVAGINFSAKTTLEVREWPYGMPDYAHADTIEALSELQPQQKPEQTKLVRYKFPRPFAVSNLPTRDISMQSIENDDGEFRMYQGVWRMQPLVGCSPPGQDAMRLTYAVEISPRVYLPVRFIESRIAQDLCGNLEAIRASVTS